ncbi:SiaC family regulatory phosphoprotein [Bacteroidota bacterium]
MGLNLKVYWYFTDGDEDMKEVGEDFSDMISVPFNFVMVER